MANVRPPNQPAGAPQYIRLPAGTALFRVHRAGYDACAHNPTLAHRYYGGGRFDSTLDDAYGYWYAGDSADVAVSEYLLRDLAVHEAGTRVLEWARVAGRRLTSVETTVDLTLLSLATGIELGALSQDTWLTTAPPRDYAQTRHWAHWIRGHAPDAAGFRWRSFREPAGFAFVLFSDRCPTDFTVPHPVAAWGAETIDFDADPRWVAATLLKYGVAIDV